MQQQYIVFPSSGVTSVERRGCTRICEPFEVKIKGVDRQGNTFDVEGMLDNISAGGLFIRLDKNIAPGAALSFTIRLSTMRSVRMHAPQLAAVGTVRRVEPQSDGRIGLGIEFIEHRFV